MKNNLSKTPLWEKSLGLIGFLLVVFTVGYLTWSALNNGNEPPKIQFNVSSIESVEQRFLVLVDIKNLGDNTATHLHLEARLTNLDGLMQRSAAKVSYLASQSTQRVGFFFTDNPDKGTLTFIPLGYQAP